jgi:type IV pilus assembly protein PilC
MSAVESDRTRMVFAYEAQTLGGERFQGTLEAVSTEDAQARLSALQLRVLAVGPAEPVKPRKGELGADEFLIFNQQLAHLTEAGLPIEKGLRLIALDLKSGRLSRAAQEVASELEKGVPLQEAFSRHATQFPPLYGKLVDAGAATGNLPGMLFNLGRHLELVSRLRRCLWRSLAYPAFVLAVTSLVFLFISLFVLPQFGPIFGDFKTTLPLLTEWVLALGRVYPWIFGIGWGLVILVAVSDGAARLLGTRGIPWIALLGYVPIIGGILKANLLARWLDGLRLAIESGLDLPRAITLAAEATGETTLIRDAAALADQMARGLPPASFATRRIPATVTAALDMVSNTGSGLELPQVIYSLSTMYGEQAEHRLRILPSILLPIYLFVIAGGVGLTITALFLPLIKLVQSVSGGG